MGVLVRCSSLLRISAVAAAAACVLVTQPAAAQNTCISRAYGVPGLPGAPLWTDPILPSTKPKKTQLDDPRWAGASRLYFPADGGTTVTEATVRASVEGTVLHLSYQTNADPGGATSPDTVWLGIGKNAAKAALAAGDPDYFLIEVPLGANVPTVYTEAHPIDTETVITSEAFTAWTNDASDTTWSLDLAPTWVTTDLLRYWVGDGTVSYDWAVNVKIDLAAIGIDTTTTFDGRFFVASFVETSFGQGWVHQFPTGAVFIDLSGNPDVVNSFDTSVINPTTWGTMNLQPTYSSPCTDGIALSFMQIGADPPPDNLINTNLPGSSAADNVYYARPDWSGWAGWTGSAPANAIQARFRLANWGSTIADPAAPWTEIAAGRLNTAGAGEMTYTCPVGTPLCGVAPAGDEHQCILVELSKGTAATTDPIKFARDSVYRNMDFDIASTLKRKAEINIKGLNALPNTTKRDTYLYVKTVNMPGPTDEQLFLPRDEMQRAVRVARNPPPKPRPPRQPDVKPPVAGAPQGQPKPAAAAPPKNLRQAAADLPPPLDPDLAGDAYDHLTASWPTYEVHAYHDTGSYITVRGKKYRALKPMVPFGYFVDHAGPYYGFEHAIEGIDGAKLVQIGPSFYKIEIANGGKAKVLTTITALEKPSGRGDRCCPSPPVKVEVKPHCYCRAVTPSGNGALFANLGAAFAAALLFGLRRRAARRSHRR